MGKEPYGAPLVRGDTGMPITRRLFFTRSKNINLPYHTDQQLIFMPNPTAGTSNDLEKCVQYAAFDAGHPPDKDSSVSASDDTAADSAKTKLAGLAASLRLFSESMLRIEQAETEMAKSREASRLETEKRRAELDTELTRVMAQTQLQIAELVAGKGERSRKRKRVEEEEKSSISGREGVAMMMNLLQCNMFL